MQKINHMQNIHYNRLFFLFIVLHLISWTCVPTFVRHNLPLDAIEGTILGRHIMWGYDKNPYLNGWLTAIAIYFSKPSGWSVYLFSQLSVVICFYAIWKLANRMLTPALALLAVMLLETVQYYNLHAIDFNDNTLELSLWALITYCFYQALTTSQKYKYWLLSGCFAGLGMMAKYYTATLLAAMSLFLFLYSDNRRQLKTLPPFCGLLVFLIVISPHIIWLSHHDFITVTYVLARAKNVPSLWNHLFFPVLFTWEQCKAFLPAVLIFFCFYIGSKTTKDLPSKDITRFDQLFLCYLAFGPIILTVTLSLVLGITLRAGWGMPLLSLWGIALCVFFKPTISITKVKYFYISILMVMVVLLIAYSTTLIYFKKNSTANFPGKKIARAVTQLWHEKFNTHLAFVAGTRWIGGNISFYSLDHPDVLMDWNQKRSPWIDLGKMKKLGAVFVWNISNKEFLPDAIKSKFKCLSPPEIMKFKYYRHHHTPQFINMGIAILPPHAHCRTLSINHP